MTALRCFLSWWSCYAVSYSISWVGVLMADGTPCPQSMEEEGSSLVFVTSPSKIIHQLALPAGPISEALGTVFMKASVIRSVGQFACTSVLSKIWARFICRAGTFPEEVNCVFFTGLND